MKKTMFVLLMVCVMATSAVAEVEGEGGGSAFGARLGYSFSPDQLFLGAHMDLGHLLGDLRVVPNFEIGFGNNVTTMAFNGDLIYDFPNTPWGVGGELGFIYSSLDNQGVSGVDDSDTDIGLSALGEYRFGMSGKSLFAQGKIGLANSPDIKLLVGMNF